MRILIGVTLTILILTGGIQGQQIDDALEQILSEVGYARSDLGYQPKGYWNRFPLDIPHRLTSFDDLFAEPLKLYDYARVMSNTVELYLDPAYADSIDDGLYKLVYNLGVDKKLGGFRSYSANLLPPPDGDDPLGVAIDRLFALGDRNTEVYTFGKRADGFDPKEKIGTALEGVPDTVRTIVAGLIVNLTEAIKWRDLAFRRCDRKDMQRAFAIRDLAQTQGDGQVYYPELDDIAATIDWPSLHYAALKTAAAAEQAQAQLRDWKDRFPNDMSVDLATPFGRIVLSSVVQRAARTTDITANSRLRPQIEVRKPIDADNCLILIEFGGNTVYTGHTGATSSLLNPVSVLIDLDGDDYYGLPEQTSPVSAGVGLLGVGCVIDSDGDDKYFGSIYAQGAGLFGVGVLLDRAGNDEYRAEESAQGCGYFGIGLCLDAGGKDTYYIYGDGQGMGGVGGGVGVLASFGGHDYYDAEPDAEIANRGDYHSQGKINGNVAQGAGFGRRGDGSDGHAWAGGLGAIIDIHGDDYYHSGNWTLGIGYWFGTGIAIDRHGDDIYESCYFTQGSGAHFCNGILIDEHGDDIHELYETSGAGLGFGWDYTNAFLINKHGDDTYRAKIISMGLAQIRSCAFLFDIGGNDKYYLGENTPGLGEGTFREGYDPPGKLTPYYSYAKSFGGFVDIGGVDQYYWFTDSTETAIDFAGDNKIWFQPDRDDPNWGHDNFGVGLDTDSGTIPEFFKWDE